ncbi:uncharacterized protein LOC113306123 [Papaver somniferum]|uniref:uncharacterized protein LOC113306123 n=1 Tax=Papaver somniferum TaxID=3469 RepID=UPI000E6F4C0E|nr:uncharacterized protein LOC113306123 [Papaver somniferum]
MALCNTSYKLISKILQRRLKPLIQKLISPMQAAYVPGRLIYENIIMVQEIVHTMKRTEAKEGILALKVDMSNAFDRLEWSFLLDIMKKFGFCNKWCELIHQCIGTTQIEVIAEFSACFRKMINFSKSSIYFSKKMNPDVCNKLAGILNVRQMNLNEKYLGLAFFIGRNKRVPFSNIVDKMKVNLDVWKEINLSEAGRTVIVKNVLNSILVYHMTSFKLPETTISSINSAQASFWKRKKNNKGLHLISNNNLCGHKHDGGLGFRDMQLFNRAILVKSAWRLRIREDDAWFKARGAKYFSNGDFFNVEEKQDSSWSWKSISSELKIVEENSCWQLGNVERIRTWYDRWIPELHQTPTSIVNPNISHQFAHVNDIFNSSAMGWDMNLHHQLFSPEVVNLISKISIHPNFKDKLVWKLKKNGCFYVKSAYKKLYEDKYNYSPTDPEMISIWIKLWKLPALPRRRFLRFMVFTRSLYKHLGELLEKQEYVKRTRKPRMTKSDDESKTDEPKTTDEKVVMLEKDMKTIQTTLDELVACIRSNTLNLKPSKKTKSPSWGSKEEDEEEEEESEEEE